MAASLTHGQSWFAQCHGWLGLCQSATGQGLCRLDWQHPGCNSWELAVYPRFCFMGHRRSWYLPLQGLEEAKDRCIGDYRCEVVCYHSKTGRAQYYQNFESLGSQVEMNVNVRLKMALAEDLLGFSLDSPRTSLCFRLRKALREVEPGRKGWNELLQKAPPWEQNGWMCLQARYFLRFGAVQCHVDPQQASIMRRNEFVQAEAGKFQAFWILALDLRRLHSAAGMQ